MNTKPYCGKNFIAFSKRAFTLAEVLITLGIIGIVAAMTMPTLIQNYKKHEVETKLARFYTTINQAIQMSETVNGDKKYWEQLTNDFETDVEGNNDYSKPKAMAWFEKYLKPYLKYSRVEVFNHNNAQSRVLVYFEDGSLLLFSSSAWLFCPNSQKFKVITNEDGSKSYNSLLFGRDGFSFFYRPNCTDNNCKYHYNKGVEPYAWSWNGNRETLFNKPIYGCTEQGTFCTKLIQLNGWKIPNDYPIKF